ncbi:sigma-54 interaction domain-containing protein [Candidatus Formimonas warabiya]|uniref:HTH-type transcriptional regulatory protein TyrR n=1 Tax=Formimonas warabiya TaxID=1761012 RepID=A0A3G1KXN8_FORW1|nr:sigma 54-interacting transcriptional regulator [Candidatus Formimonas warabiya]ATW27248.1 Fis family transcriptional regulator [Candidatus Formimonas warabiya]
MIKLADISHDDFFLLPSGAKVADVLEDILDHHTQYIIRCSEKEVGAVYRTSVLLREALKNGSGSLGENILVSERFAVIQEGDSLLDLLALEDHPDLIVLVNEGTVPVGMIDGLEAIRKLLHDFYGMIPGTKLSLPEYRDIVEQLEEEIFVTDGAGFILYLNPEGEKVCGVKLEEVIGKHVSDLEKAKIFTSSTTVEVLKTKKKANLLQKLKSGKTVLATGRPIFDQKGRLVRVLSTTKDVREINHLMEQIEQKNKEIKHKNQELTLLRESIFAQDNFVCKSPKMTGIKDTIIKIAPTDITVLIQGESGVGKEVVTKLIHNLGLRNRYPLIKINCGLIPENLLESELFGYEGGAFTGANKHGKLGKIELANQGTLFLDEIGEMPLSLQVKLLEFLQDREFTRVGGTQKIKIDTRVILATNRDLQTMVNQGRFRRDLFYRLNVLPINIPPLRERVEDIPVLAEYFLDQFNNKYQMNKKLAPDVIEAFYEYDWPGNVRELVHFIERIMVISDADFITRDMLPEVFGGNPSPRQTIICTDLIPLKKAKNELEAQLIKRAYEIYKSTYKVGKVLEIDQSTVVKLLKKYR